MKNLLRLASVLLLAVGLQLPPLAAQQFGTARTGRTGASSLGEPRQYRSSTLLGDAMIEVDSETRSLVIVADDETNAEILKIIKNLDRPKPQVLIKVLFIEVTHGDGLDLGVEGNYRYTHEGIQEGNVGTVFGLAQQFDGGFWKVIGDNWEATLRAMAESGKLEVLSRPSILARNNQEAVIMVGEEVPFITNSRITDNGQTINTVEYQDIGIILRVTPFITSEGLVEMIVAPEISTMTDETVPISDTAEVRVIAKRTAETVVVTPNGKTVVIGGLMENQKTVAVKKVPLLGDIPLLGLAFKRTITANKKKELMIFLTPYIVNDPRDLDTITTQEAGKATMTPKAFSPAEISQHLDGVPIHSPGKSPHTGTQTPPPAD